MAVINRGRYRFKSAAINLVHAPGRFAVAVNHPQSKGRLLRPSDQTTGNAQNHRGLVVG